MKIKLLFLIFLTSCGLKPVPPKKGIFCNVLSRPIECVEIDFRNEKIIYKNQSYILIKNTVASYTFNNESNTHNVEVLNENRVQINENNILKFYLRKKNAR